MKKLYKIMVVFVFIIFSKTSFAMNYREDDTKKNGNNDISSEFIKLTWDQFVKIFSEKYGSSDEKQKDFWQLYLEQ
jgi:hypothetical protein